MHKPTLTLAVMSTLLAAPTIAQQKNDAGLGTVKRTWDTSNAPAVRDALIIGVCYLNGLYYVSGRGDGTQRLLYEYDPSGNLLRTITAPPIAQGTTNGVRGMATDGVNIIGGTAVGLIAFDINGMPVTTLSTMNNPAAPLGPQPIQGPAYALLGNIFRGVAYDPAGNAGNGSIWVSNNGTGLPIIEIDLQGNILTQLPDMGWEAYGLARDPTTGNLWVNSLVDASNPNGGPIFELDVTTGVPTGAQFAQAHTDFHAGIDIVPGGDPGSYSSEFDLVAVNQSYADIAAVHRLHLYPNFNGTGEAFLEGSINAAPLTVGGLGQFQATDTLNWNINPSNNPINNGTLAWIFVNLGDDALCDFATSIPIPGLPSPYPEVRVASAFSTPPSLFAPIVATSVGAPGSLTIPGGIFAGFDVIRMQAVYLDLALATAGNPFPFVATSEIFTHHFDETTADIIVEADGANSFVGGVPLGFWKVRNISGADIVEVTLDFERSTNPFHLNDDMRFDLDETNMADLFTAGNSTDPTCFGTYRNNSDVTTGLVYDPLNFPPALCNVTNPNPNSGFIAIGPGVPTASAYYGITFRFTDFNAGETFEWDVDTDGGTGTDGASMAGLYIEVKLANGRTLCGELRADPSNPTRSVWGGR